MGEAGELVGSDELPVGQSSALDGTPTPVGQSSALNGTPTPVGQSSALDSLADKFIVGLTGNIACGKSTVLARLAEGGAGIIDADMVTRELQRKGAPAYGPV